MADTTNKAQQMFNEQTKSEKTQEETLLEIKEAILLSTQQQAQFAARAERFEENQLAIQEEELKLRKMEVSRNRFSRLKAGAGMVGAAGMGAYGIGKKMVQFDKTRQKSWAKLAFAEMVSAGVITAIVTGVLGTAMFKKLFSDTSEETKAMSRAAAAATKLPRASKTAMSLGKGAKSLLSDMGKPGVGFKQGAKNLAKGFAAKQFDKLVMSQVRSIQSTYSFMADQAKIAGGAFMKGGGSGIAANLLGGTTEAASAGSKVASATGIAGKARALGSGALAMGKGAAGLGVKGTAKALGGGLLKGGASAGLSLGKGALKGVAGIAGKSLAKIGGKVASKFIPGLGAVFSLYSGIDRWKKDDKVGAFIDFGSAVANLIPGLGGFLSLGLDMINMARDFKSMPPEKQQSTLQKGRAIARHIPGLGLGISIADSVKMFANGDIQGGLKELAGGISSTIPGGRWAFDAGLELLDAFHGTENAMSGTAQTIKKVSKGQMKNIPIIGTFLRMKDAFKLYEQGKTKEAMIAGAKALGTMIPGVGLLYNFFEETKEPMAMPSSSAQQQGRGNITASQGKSGLSKLRKGIIAGKAAGKDVSHLESRRDSLVAQMKNGGVPISLSESSKQHTKVKSKSSADMNNVKWDDMGGRSGIEAAILGAWNDAGIEAPPTFTSGYRDASGNLGLKLANTKSKHLTGHAFDLRGKDVPKEKRASVTSSLIQSLGSAGFGVLPHGEGDNFHYHVQYPKKGLDMVAAAEANNAVV